MTLTDDKKVMLIHADARFVAAVCALLAESSAEAVDYFEVYARSRRPESYLSRDELTAKDFRAILLQTAKTSVKLLEGR